MSEIKIMITIDKAVHNPGWYLPVYIITGIDKTMPKKSEYPYFFDENLFNLKKLIIKVVTNNIDDIIKYLNSNSIIYFGILKSKSLKNNIIGLKRSLTENVFSIPILEDGRIVL